MKYGVRLEGANYEVNFEGEVKLMGFVTTRFVKAGSPSEAEKEAIKLIFEDQHLNNIMVSGSHHQATLKVTEMWEESWWKIPGGRGYSFFSMEPERQ